MTTQGGDLAWRGTTNHKTTRHLLQDPAALADPQTAWTDAHPTLCGLRRLGDALPDADYSRFPMCKQCMTIAARPGRQGARK